MELHAVYRQLSMPNGHNDIFESGRNFEAIGDFEGAEAVVSSGLERVLDAAKDAFFIMRNP